MEKLIKISEEQNLIKKDNERNLKELFESIESIKFEIDKIDWNNYHSNLQADLKETVENFVYEIEKKIENFEFETIEILNKGDK